MLGTDLQRPRGPLRRVKLITGMAVINREHVTAFELPRHIVDPIERGEVYFGLVTRKALRQVL